MQTTGRPFSPLFACSLVSKHWLPSSRYHLFGDLTLHLGGAYEAAFLSLLAHELCTFSTSVRKIWILPQQELEADLSKGMNDNIAQLGKLTSVRTLRIHRQRIIPSQTLSAIATAFKNITILVMMLRFTTFSDALRFMCAFRDLEEVHFEPVRTPPGGYPPADVVMPPNLRSVYIDTIRGHERWFADHRTPTLTALSVVNVRPLDDINRLDGMLEGFGHHLRHLTLQFANQKGEFDVQMNLAHNTQLRSVEIDLSKLTRRHLLPAIASIRSLYLEAIVWRTRRSFDFPAPSWSELDELLADRSALPALKKFTILAPKPSTASFNPRMLMPSCDALGILCGDQDIVPEDD
ncbi:RING-type domain-containing protein [Favolaschia claudopus]|uniref:RING-type domain-containing protein n=1 Tax=Favolaschia claudopus TaxID=2862362 RepID=A0AAW0AAX0_9AGAR